MPLQQLEPVTTMLRALEKPGLWWEGVLQAGRGALQKQDVRHVTR